MFPYPLTTERLASKNYNEESCRRKWCCKAGHDPWSSAKHGRGWRSPCEHDRTSCSLTRSLQSDLLAKITTRNLVDKNGVPGLDMTPVAVASIFWASFYPASVIEHHVPLPAHYRATC